MRMWNGTVAIGGLMLLAACGSSEDEPVEYPDVELAMMGDTELQAATDAISNAASNAAEERGRTIDAGPALTGPQRNARRNAEEYLQMTGFSRNGLIDQLSSEYGSAYARSDAEAAVDSLNVDWQAQAVRSAEQYLAMTGFSCNGLIEQLSSSHGSGYTREEAAYGAAAAGAC